MGWEARARDAAAAGVRDMERFRVWRPHRGRVQAGEAALDTLDRLEGGRLHPAVAVARAMETAVAGDSKAREAALLASLKYLGENAALLAAGGAAPLAALAVHVAREAPAAAPAGAEAVARLAPDAWVAAVQARPAPERLDLLTLPLPSSPEQALDHAAHLEKSADLAAWQLREALRLAEGDPLQPALKLAVDALDLPGASAAAVLGALRQPGPTPETVARALVHSARSAADAVRLGELALSRVPPEVGGWAAPLLAAAGSDETARAAVLRAALGAPWTPDRPRAALAALMGDTAARSLGPALKEELARQARGTNRSPDVTTALELAPRLGLDDSAALRLGLAALERAGGPMEAVDWLGAALPLGQPRAAFEKALSDWARDRAAAGGEEGTRAALDLLDRLVPADDSRGLLRRGLEWLVSTRPGLAEGALAGLGPLLLDADPSAAWLEKVSGELLSRLPASPARALLEELPATPAVLDRDRPRAVAAGLKALLAAGSGDPLPRVGAAALGRFNRAPDRNRVVRRTLALLAEAEEARGSATGEALARAALRLGEGAAHGEWGRARVGHAVLEALAGPSPVETLGSASAVLADGARRALPDAFTPEARQALAEETLSGLLETSRAEGDTTLVPGIVGRGREALRAAADDAARTAVLQKVLDQVVQSGEIVKMSRGGRPAGEEGQVIHPGEDHVEIGDVRLPVQR